MPDQTDEPRYRADVDGMRAVAVLAVIAYHVLDHVAAGGFLGVDVFFVISGYLITQIIDREVAAGHYTVWRFYERRVRRILPALVVLIAIVLAVGVAVFLPFDLLNLSRSIFATFAFVSNIYFWRDSGYFGPAAITKPLLHTWSLGIEEQFYIVAPLLLWLILRAGRRRTMIAVLVGISLLSYGAAAAWLLVQKPAPAFFLLPMRAWELGVGSALAIARARPPARRWLREGLAAFGALLVLAGCLLQKAYLIRPVPDATFVVAGTALLLWTGQASTRVAQMLSVRPMVWVGLISYSLYLWHWPLYVFTCYVLIGQPDWAGRIALVALSLGAAHLSWRYIERPFRGRKMPIRRVLGWTLGGTAVVAAAAAALIAGRGLPQRVPKAAAAYNRVDGTYYRCDVSDYLPFGGLYACAMNLPGRDPSVSEVVLLGNSHAETFVPAVEPSLRKRGLPGILVTAQGCLPIEGFNTSPACVDLSHRNLAGIERLQHVKVVVIVVGWHAVLQTMYDKQGRDIGVQAWSRFEAAFDETIRRFRGRGLQVIVAGPIPYPGYQVASVVSREIAFYERPMSPMAQSRSVFDREFGAVEQWLRTRPGGSQPLFLSDRFCDRRLCRYSIDGQPVFADGNHLSRFAAPYFEPRFDEAIGHALDASRNAGGK